MIAAIAFVHKLGVVHRDLKPENMLLDGPLERAEVRLKLADFGLAIRVSPGQLISEKVGTPAYMAPEMYGDRVAYDRGIDMWALGVVAFFATTGDLPFVDQNLNVIYDRLLNGAPTHWHTPFGPMSRVAREWIQGLLSPRRDCRFSADTALRHQWLNPIGDTKIAVFECKEQDESCEGPDLTFLEWMSNTFPTASVIFNPAACQNASDEFVGVRKVSTRRVSCI